MPVQGWIRHLSVQVQSRSLKRKRRFSLVDSWLTVRIPSCFGGNSFVAHIFFQLASHKFPIVRRQLRVRV